jgi:hypothetical protein
MLQAHVFTGEALLVSASSTSTSAATDATALSFLDA